MEKVIIELDNRWELADFAVLTKEYLQLYGFFLWPKRRIKRIFNNALGGWAQCGELF